MRAGARKYAFPSSRDGFPGCQRFVLFPLPNYGRCCRRRASLFCRSCSTTRLSEFLVSIEMQLGRPLRRGRAEEGKLFSKRVLLRVDSEPAKRKIKGRSDKRDEHSELASSTASFVWLRVTGVGYRLSRRSSFCAGVSYWKRNKTWCLL